MKANAKPELSKKWWTSEKPADIKGADLEKALASVEKALAEEKKKKGDGPAIEAAMTALGELEVRGRQDDQEGVRQEEAQGRDSPCWRSTSP